LRRGTLLTCAAVACCAAVVGTAVAAAPTATTGPAENVTATTATVTGTVSPNGEQTNYHFEYGTTTAYGSRTATDNAGGGNNDRPVDANLTGLSPSTTYHYRLVATNGSGTTNGNDATFTTPAAGQQATPVTIAANPATVTFGNATAISGQVTGRDAANARVELEQNPAPFSPPFRSLANGTTDAAGNYSFTGVMPSVNTQYHVTARTSPPVTSPDITVNVRPRVTLRLSDSTPARGERVRFRGTVLPAHDGRQVRLQRRTRRGWRTIATPLLRTATPVNGVPRSKYGVRRRVRSSGQYRTVFVPNDGDHVRGQSRRKRARVH
jgi:hypothetical protein